MSSSTSPPRRRKSSGRNGGGGSVGAVGDDMQARQRQARHAVDEELNVVGAVGGVVLDRGQAGRIGSFALRCVMQDLVLHGQLDRVGELEAVGAEELDAVVAPGIVRGGDDHAGLKSMSAGKKGDGRSGHNARALDADAGLTQAGGERGGNPGAGLAGVAAEDHFGLGGRFAQGVAQRQAD